VDSEGNRVELEKGGVAPNTPYSDVSAVPVAVDESHGSLRVVC
jgi:hypothetical protein